MKTRPPVSSCLGGAPARPLGPHDALLIVDLQNSFVSPPPLGTLSVPGAVALLPLANRLAAAAAAAGAAVVASQDWHPPVS